jgi:hypothetical protein
LDGGEAVLPENRSSEGNEGKTKEGYKPWACICRSRKAAEAEKAWKYLGDDGFHAQDVLPEVVFVYPYGS